MGDQVMHTSAAPAAPIPAPAKSLGSIALGMVSGAGLLAGGGTAISAAALEGFTEELWRQASDTFSADKVKAALADLADGHLGEFSGGFSAGLVFGFVSPVTDLLGLAALPEQLPLIAASLARRSWDGAAALAREAELLASSASGLGRHVRAALRDVVTNPEQLAELIAALGPGARAAAHDAGVAGARTVLSLFSEEEPKERKDTSLSDVFTSTREGERAGVLSFGLSKATRLRKYAFRAKWADIGYRIGHAVGTVIANLLLLVFSEGVGNAIAKIAGWLGEAAPLLARGAKGLATLGRGIAMVEKTIADLLAKGISKIKPLQRVVEPLLALLGRFQGFLRRLFGVAEKEGAALAARGGAASLDEALESTTGKALGTPTTTGPPSKAPGTPALKPASPPTKAAPSAAKLTPAPAPAASAPASAAGRPGAKGASVSPIHGPTRPRSAVSAAQEAGLSTVEKGSRPVSRIGPRTQGPHPSAPAAARVPAEEPAHLAATGTDGPRVIPLKPAGGRPGGTSPVGPRASSSGGGPKSPAPVTPGPTPAGPRPAVAPARPAAPSTGRAGPAARPSRGSTPPSSSTSRPPSKAEEIEELFAEQQGRAPRDDQYLDPGSSREHPSTPVTSDRPHQPVRPSRGPSDELEAAMARQGNPRPPGHQTHHIVAYNDPRARKACAILEEAGINPRNDPRNGIHLPGTTMDPRTVAEAYSRHASIHTDAYYEHLTARLQAARDAGRVEETLATIYGEIAHGQFPHPRKRN